MAKTGEQMIGAVSDVAAGTPGTIVLGPDDVPAMMELAELTKPGPSSARTYELGTFLGIRVGNQLAAMAGERMKLDGYSEITAVWTHPSNRGRGYAQALLSAVSRRGARRDAVPARVFRQRAGHRVVPSDGSRIRRRLYVTVLGNRS